VPAASHSPRPGRSRSIGVIAPLSSEVTTYHVDLVRALRDAAEREKHELQRRLVVLDVPREDPSELEAILIDDLTLKLSGLIVVNAQISDAARAALRHADIPTVSITNRDASPPVVCSVVPDHTDFDTMLEHVLVGRDCTAALLLTRRPQSAARGSEADQSRLEKRAIFEKAAAAALLRPAADTTIEELGSGHATIGPGQSLIVHVDHYRESYGERLFAVIGEQLPHNSCVCFLADVVALAFLRACESSERSARERGLRLTGFDNTPQSKAFGLTTVDYQLGRVARCAYDRLQAALDAPDDRRHTYDVVPTRLHLRASTEW
jgi:DNA-binding LacI/PurR family transcriptional regulator